MNATKLGFLKVAKTLENFLAVRQRQPGQLLQNLSFAHA
jgi:hypothetical protein